MESPVISCKICLVMLLEINAKEHYMWHYRNHPVDNLAARRLAEQS